MPQLDDIGNPNAPKGSPSWCSALRAEAQSEINDAKARVGRLKVKLQSFRDHAYFSSLYDKDGRPFPSWEDFCQYPRPWGLGFPVAAANAVIAEVNPDKLVSTVIDAFLNAPTQVGPGQGARTDIQPRYSVTKLGRGNDRDYLAARIKQDHPEIAKAILRGEFSSIRQAAIAAGIIRQPSALDQLRKAWKKATPKQRNTFLAEVR